MKIKIRMTDIFDNQRYNDILWKNIIKSPIYNEKIKIDENFQDFYISISKDHKFDFENEYNNNLPYFDLTYQYQESDKLVNFYIKKMGPQFIIDFFNFHAKHKEIHNLGETRPLIYYFIIKPWISEKVWGRILFDRFIFNPISYSDDTKSSEQEFSIIIPTKDVAIKFNENCYKELKNSFENAVKAQFRDFNSFLIDDRYYPPNWDKFSKILGSFLKNYIEDFIYYLEDVSLEKIIDDFETFARFQLLIDNLLSNSAFSEYKLLLLQFSIPNFCEKIKKFYLKTIKKKIYILFSPKSRKSNNSNKDDKNRLINLKNLSEMFFEIEPSFSDYISIDSNNDHYLYPRSLIIQQFPINKRVFERYGIHSAKNSFGFLNLSLTLDIFPKYENNINLIVYLWRILSHCTSNYGIYSYSYFRTLKNRNYFPEELMNILNQPYESFINKIIMGREKKTNQHYIQTYFKNNISIYQELLDKIQYTKNKTFLVEIFSTFTSGFHNRLLKLHKNHKRVKKNVKMIKILSYLKKELEL